jgi:hypothetical protein
MYSAALFLFDTDFPIDSASLSPSQVVGLGRKWGQRKWGNGDMGKWGQGQYLSCMKWGQGQYLS